MRTQNSTFKFDQQTLSKLQKLADGELLGIKTSRTKALEYLVAHAIKESEE